MAAALKEGFPRKTSKEANVSNSIIAQSRRQRIARTRTQLSCEYSPLIQHDSAQGETPQQWPENLIKHPISGVTSIAIKLFLSDTLFSAKKSTQLSLTKFL